MRIDILAVGRLKSGPEKELYESYAKLVRGLARQSGITSLELREVPEARAATALERRRDEGKTLAAAVRQGADLIGLDAGGRELDSEAFAADFAHRRDTGRHVQFLIGGPDGLAPELLDRAALVLSFGRATWPHRLVRVMLAEQIYRAVTILLNHPYHRA